MEADARAVIREFIDQLKLELQENKERIGERAYKQAMGLTELSSEPLKSGFPWLEGELKLPIRDVQYGLIGAIAALEKVLLLMD